MNKPAYILVIGACIALLIVFLRGSASLDHPLGVQEGMIRFSAPSLNAEYGPPAGTLPPEWDGWGWTLYWDDWGKRYAFHHRDVDELGVVKERYTVNYLDDQFIYWYESYDQQVRRHVPRHGKDPRHNFTFSISGPRSGMVFSGTDTVVGRKCTLFEQSPYPELGVFEYCVWKDIVLRVRHRDQDSEDWEVEKIATSIDVTTPVAEEVFFVPDDAPVIDADS